MSPTNSGHRGKRVEKYCPTVDKSVSNNIATCVCSALESVTLKIQRRIIRCPCALFRSQRRLRFPSLFETFFTSMKTIVKEVCASGTWKLL